MTASTLFASPPGRARRAALAASAAVTTLAWCAAAHALPVVGTAGGVVIGSASIGTIGSTETVTRVRSARSSSGRASTSARAETI